jgi:uncharacterized protein (TIGR02145 family)
VLGCCIRKVGGCQRCRDTQRITHNDGDDMTTMRIGVVAIALSMACGLVLDAGPTQRPGKDQSPSGAASFSKRMADGKEWTTSNLSVNMPSSYCYEDAESYCRRYGRLYTWESAQRGCQSLGGGWRLPTDDEWRQLAKHYGGLADDSPDKGEAAFTALLSGGRSGFNAVFAGTRSAAGESERLEAHGIYWTSTATDQNSARFYNFGKGGQGVSRHVQGGKQMAVFVRCVRP